MMGTATPANLTLSPCPSRPGTVRPPCTTTAQTHSGLVSVSLSRMCAPRHPPVVTMHVCTGTTTVATPPSRAGDLDDGAGTPASSRATETNAPPISPLTLHARDQVSPRDFRRTIGRGDWTRPCTPSPCAVSLSPSLLSSTRVRPRRGSAPQPRSHRPSPPMHCCRRPFPLATDPVHRAPALPL
jgi:hypothetical protein